MKVNSIKQQNFRGVGSLGDRLANTISKHPKVVSTIAGALAASSVVSQKLVMSAGEVTIAPLVDIGVGKAITKLTDEKDGRTNQSSKVQAVRTIAQTVGGTMTGIVIRVACIAAATAACMWAGEKAGGKIAEVLAQGKDEIITPAQKFKYSEHMQKWGKSIGGALATGVMMFTNFIIDAPLINRINKKISPLFGIKSEEQDNAKGAK